MGADNNKLAPVTCVGCGITGTEIDDGGRETVWLRTDYGLRLGVCSGCGEWTGAWDNGMRHEGSAGAPQDLYRLIQNATLPSLSHVLLEIYDLLSSDTAGADQIARLIETDAGLSARTLRLANSAFYGLSRKITTVPEALSRIGPFDLWWLLLTTEVKSLFYGIDRSLADMSGFWRHSLMVASAGRALSERYRIGSPAELFVAGLLHDVGKLLLLQCLPVEYVGVLQLAARDERELHLLEQEQLGFDHATAGAALLDQWKLPFALIGQVAGHHREYRELTEASLIAAANDLANRSDAPDESPCIPEILDQAVIAATERLFQRLSGLVL